MGHFELDASGPPPVFILSHERSGSTFLRIVLDTHSEVCCPAELVLAPAAENLSHVLDNTLGVAIAELQGEAGAQGRALEVRRILNGVMRAYARAKGKSVWCEKWPRSSRLLPVLQRVFPDARYVCLYRECLDTAASCLVTYGRYGYPSSLHGSVASHPDNFALGMVVSWIEETTRLLAVEANEAIPTHRVRYEDVVTAPERTLPPLFAFLGLAWEPDIVTRVFSTQHDGLGVGGDRNVMYKDSFDASSIGRGATIIPMSKLTKQVVARANELCRKLGYAELGARPAQAAQRAQPEVRSVIQEAVDALVGQIFQQKVPEVLRSNAARMTGLSGIVRFIVSDGRPREWTLAYREAEVTMAPADAKPDATVTLDQAMLLEIAARRTNVLTARREGKIAFDGDSQYLGLLAWFF